MFCGNIFAVCAGTVKTCFLTVLFLLLPAGLKQDDHLFTFSIRFFRLFQSGYFSITILFRDFDWQMLYPHAVFFFFTYFFKKNGYTKLYRINIFAIHHMNNRKYAIVSPNMGT